MHNEKSKIPLIFDSCYKLLEAIICNVVVAEFDEIGSWNTFSEKLKKSAELSYS